MKKALKIIGISLLGLGVVIAAILLYLQFSSIPYYETSKLDYKAVSTPESIARGQKLATLLCATCHMNHQTGKLSGTRMMDAPAEFGEIHSANITQDPTYGIGNWTDGEILYLLRTGIKKNGQYAPPYMAKLPTMADEDINAIIAFLRSDHPLVTADPRPDQPTKPSLLTKILCRVVMKPFPMPTEKIDLPDTTQMIALGKYLAHNLDCFSCHSADFKTNDFLTPENSPGYFGGGNQPLDKKGRVMRTPNLTPDKETGIGTWTEDKFVKAVKYGIVEGQNALQYPMQPYTLLTDTEAKAIFRYLQTIPPIHNKVERSEYDD